MKLRTLLVTIAVLLAAMVPAPAALATTSSAYRWQMIFAINAVRHRYELPPLHYGRSLSDAAQWHSTDMVRHHYFAHTSPTGSTVASRLLYFGFLHYGSWWAGETIGYGSGTYGSVWGTLGMWMRSPEHRAILLSPDYSWIGVGRAAGPFCGYPWAVVWTADLGHR